MNKYDVLIVDTINSIQNKEYMEILDTATMVSRDKWRDFGVNVYMLMEGLKELDMIQCLVIGKEGTGKSFSISTLDPTKTVWMHADNKPITFKGGNQNYVKGVNLYVPTTYKEVLDMAKLMKERNRKRAEKSGEPEQPIVVFLLGHVAVYDGPQNSVHERLKTLGAFATKMNIEGAVSYCFYTDVEGSGKNRKYRLITQNTGYNTARTPQGLFEDDIIPNDFNLILKAIREY
jgi:hypothetical protein